MSKYRITYPTPRSHREAILYMVKMQGFDVQDSDMYEHAPGVTTLVLGETEDVAKVNLIAGTIAVLFAYSSSEMIVTAEA